MQAIFNHICAINSKYKLSNAILEQQMKKLECQKVTIPIIGKFSTGKTALINRLLNYSRNLLPENITPETAVPTEICFNEGYDIVEVKTVEGTNVISIEEYQNTIFDFKEIKSITLQLDKSFLSTIKDIMIVDMPGFDSGYEIHNKAIDDYLPQSLAYLITFTAEDMSLKYNMISVLKELILHDMPICIIITKADKVANDILADNLNKLKADLGKHLGKTNFRYCITSSREGEVDELIAFLQELQMQSQEIINKKYKMIACQLASDTENFITTLISNQRLTMSELSEKEQALSGEMEEVKKAISSQSDAFSRIIPTCINEIKADLLNALNREENTLVAMVMNGQDISERVNSIVRITITESIKVRFIPKVQKHIERITSQLDSMVSVNTGLISEKLTVNTNNLTKNVVNTAVAAIGVMFLGPILALVGGVIAWFIGNKQKERERQAQKAQVSQKLRGDVFPNVLQQISIQLETELIKHAEEINALLAEEINNQYNTLSFALEEVIKQRKIENEEKEQLLREANADLIELGGIKNECK